MPPPTRARTPATSARSSLSGTSSTSRRRVARPTGTNSSGTPDTALVAPRPCLRAAGILYAPDFVINAGGVLHSVGVEAFAWDRTTVELRLAGIGDTLAGIYARADAEQITTQAAAVELARARLR